MDGELTTGEFARASGLTRKALRLYDGLGLLRPARTDPATGYRHYAAGQLGHARRVAWLRRIGMPLARIRSCSELPAGDLAAAVRDWWSGEERADAQRRALVVALVEALHEEDDMTIIATTGALRLRCAAATAQGPVRDRQQDAAGGDERFAAVADGFGPAGEAVSTRVLEAVAGSSADGAGTVLDTLDRAVRAVVDEVSGRPTGTRSTPRSTSGDRPPAAPPASGGVDGPRADEDGPDLPVSGSTVTALVLAGGDRLALVHVGDSRAYLLRDGVLSRLTHDHTLVRSMVEAGTLTEAEASSHPQRATLLRAVAPGQDGPDLALHAVREGDRYALATDGLHAVVAPDAVAATLRTATEPADAAGALVDLALTAGAPDNVAVAVADVVH